MRVEFSRSVARIRWVVRADARAVGVAWRKRQRPPVG